MVKSNKDRYRSLQLNMSWEKHRDLIEWLDNRASEDETSLNSIVLRALKEYMKNEKEKSDR